MKLVSNGDSWTYGSEIACPEILAGPGEKGYGMLNRYKKDMYDTFPINDYYRIPRIWPTQLAEKMGAENINISWPGRSNDSIYSSTVGWVLNYLAEGGDPSELFVVVGWSSPERKDILIQDFDDKKYKINFHPAMEGDQYYLIDVAKKYFNFYVSHLCIEQEFITRYVEQNYNLHLLLKSHGIKHLFFNAFYLWDHLPIPVHTWKDVDLCDVISAWHNVPMAGHYEGTWMPKDEVNRVLNMWKALPADVFYKKDTMGSFKSYVDDVVPHETRMINMHPSPESHSAWANFLGTILL